MEIPGFDSMLWLYKLLTVRDAKWRVYGNVLYYFCGFPVCLKLSQNNKLEKAHRKRTIGGSSVGNSFMEFSWKGEKRTNGSLWSKQAQESFLVCWVWFLFLLSQEKQHHACGQWESSDRKMKTDHAGKSYFWSTVLKEEKWDATLFAFR